MPELIENPYDGEQYRPVTLTKVTNKTAVKYGLVRQSGVYRVEGIYTDDIVFDEIEGRISLIPARQRGDEQNTVTEEKAKRRYFQASHLPLKSYISAGAVKRAMQPGTNRQKRLQEVMAARLADLKRKHAITDELQRVSGLSGIVLNSDGTTLHNMFTSFGITRKVIDFKFSVDTTEIENVCDELVQHTSDNLLGDTHDGVHVYASKSWMDDFIHHPNVEKYWLNHKEALNLVGAKVSPRQAFHFGGVVFTQYEAKAYDPISKTTKRFIPDGEAISYPTGTMDTFVMHYAPADYFDQLGLTGEEVHVRQRMNADGDQIIIKSESNPLPLCREPACLARITKS